MGLDTQTPEEGAEEGAWRATPQTGPAAMLLYAAGAGWFLNCVVTVTIDDELKNVEGGGTLQLLVRLCGENAPPNYLPCESPQRRGC